MLIQGILANFDDLANLSMQIDYDITHMLNLRLDMFFKSWILNDLCFGQECAVYDLQYVCVCSLNQNIQNAYW